MTKCIDDSIFHWSIFDQSDCLTQKSRRNNEKCDVTAQTNAMRVSYDSTPTQIQRFFQNLNEFFDSKSFSDLTFVVGKETFQCHRIIVASCSPYFQALLTHQFKENHLETIVLSDIEPKIFSHLLRFVYSGKIEIDEENVHQLLVASDMFQLDEVMQFCSHYLSVSLNEENALETWKIADELEFQTLKSDAEQFILTHFRNLIQRDQIKDFPRSLLIKMISNDDLIVDREQQVLEAILVWYVHNVEPSSFEQLVENVRFDYISSEHQTLIFHQLSLINPKLIERIERILSQRTSSISTNRPARRGTRQTCFLFGGFVSANDNVEVQLSSTSYRCHLKTHEGSSLFYIDLEPIEGATMRYPRMHHQIAALGSLIYVVGGEDGENIFNSVEIFDPLAKTPEQQWIQTGSMITPRCNFGLVAVNSTTLYALGGHIGADITSTIEKFDCQTGLWTSLSFRLKSPCYGFACVYLNGRIYCLGGSCIFNLPVKTTEIFHPETGQSYFCTDLFDARAFPSACVDEEQEKIFVFGGADANGNGLRTVEMYNVYQCRWFRLPSMFFNRISPSVYRIENFIFVFGGRTNLNSSGEILNSVEIFDTLKNTWSRTDDLPIRVYGAATILR